ncbi:putative proteasome subunit beta type-7 [Golovinomyces cichoracearum]|uniref:Proteasome subunit beta n=1 Tax=Golovinomyces cichoracearum TaxID=62708 RepID=A0A420I500_9PEZI|nr:putative proteasome subunit beta type-7 [Golovinomyces cichoracearum]
MNHYPQAWGRPRDDIYGPYDSSYLQTYGPKQQTQTPIVTGTSVIAVKFKDGVVIAADNLGNSTVVGFGGDISDMQYVDRILNSLDIEAAYEPSGNTLNAKNIHTYLSKIYYKRRSDFDPLWNHILVAGLDEEDKPFLASADLLGTTFSSPSLATGYGGHLAQPLLRKVVPDEETASKLPLESALSVVKESLKVLFYRDARSLDKYSIAVVTKDGIDLKEDEKLENQSWAFADKIRGYGTQIN